MHKLDARGRDTTLWDAKAYGERLAVVGKDDLTAGWPNRPFQVEWNPGDQFVLEVYDRQDRPLLPSPGDSPWPGRFGRRRIPAQVR